MLRFLLGRLAVLIPTFIGVSIIAFSFIRMLPGDPVALLSGERVMDPERHAEISKALGFDRPIVIQYLDYLWGVLHGDFGTSISTKDSVLSQFFTALSGDTGAFALRHHLCRRARHSGRRLRRRQARFVLRPAHDGNRPYRLFDADLLVGPASHHPVLRHSAMDAGVGARFRSCISSRRSPASC